MLPDYLLRNLTLVKAATSTNRWNDTQYDYGPAATRTTIRGYIDQAGASRGGTNVQVSDDRNALLALWRLLTNDLTVDGYDRIEDGSNVYQIDGPPWIVMRPGSGPHHLEARLRTVDG